MEINMTKNGTELTVALDGRLDSTTSPAFDKALEGALDDVERLVFDFSNLDYISSAGLRVMLNAMLTVAKQGETVVKGASKTVLELFDIAGLTEELKIE